jgi:DNA-binding response OmpR family regulator
LYSVHRELEERTMTTADIMYRSDKHLISMFTQLCTNEVLKSCNIKFQLCDSGFAFNSTKSKQLNKCSPNALKTMLLFTQNIDEIVTKREIENFVWGQAIGNTSVPVVINEIRSILADSNLILITVRGKGYALINRSLTS